MGTAKAPHDTTRPPHPRMIKALESGDPEKVRLALTIRQRRFCEEYAIDFKGAESAIRAGYAVEYANRQAYLNLMNPGVQFYIDHLTQSAQAKVMSVTPDYIIQGILAIVAKEQGRDGDKLRGYELLAKILGMLKERTELTGKDGGPIEVERVNEEARDFNNMLRALRKKQEKVDVVV